MSRAGVEGFAVQFLEDLGAVVSEREGLIWAEIPDGLRSALELPDHAVLTLEPERVGEFGAELLAPGSYLLERLLARAMARGRWDVVRSSDAADNWALEIAGLAGLPSGWTPLVAEHGAEIIPVFSFRTTLAADDKRESFVSLAVFPGETVGQQLPWAVAAQDLPPATLPPDSFDFQAAYETARASLSSIMRGDVASFRKDALSALEEEVRRVFRYFDGTLAEIRSSGDSDSDSFLRAVEAERDRRLAEAVERFEPSATAMLASVRVVVSQVARVRLRAGDGDEVDLRIDSFTKSIRGLQCVACGSSNGPWNSLRPDRCVRCAATEAASAPLPVHPRSGIARRRRTADRAAARSPRGSTARSRFGDGSRRRS